MPTREELQSQIAALQLQLDQTQYTPEGPHALASTDQTTVTETPDQTTIKTVHTPPTSATFPAGGRIAVRSSLLTPKQGAQTPDELTAAIISIKSLITSGVDSAGYGDKRTEFRSLSDLRQILNALEDELAALLGGRGKTRQIRMTAQWDKGL